MSTDDYLEWVDTHRDDLNLTLPVSEVFGPTIQGEGPHAGRACQTRRRSRLPAARRCR